MDKNTLGDVPTEVWRLIYKTFKEEVLDLIDIDNSVDAEKVAAIVAQPDGASRVKDLVNLLKGKRGAILAAFGPAYSSHAADCIVEAWKNSGRPDLPKVYVDIGCGKGDKTAAIAKRFSVDPCCASGYEVTCSSYTEDERDAGSSSSFCFKTYDGKQFFDISDGSCDLVTCLMTLHHAVNPAGVLQEIRRVLSPNGRFVIKEHDCTSVVFAQYLDMYHVVFSEILTPEKPFHMKAVYHTRSQWQEMLKSVGFTKLWGSNIIYTSMQDYFDVYGVSQ